MTDLAYDASRTLDRASRAIADLSPESFSDAEAARVHARMGDAIIAASDYRIALVTAHPALATPATVSPHGSGCFTSSPPSEAPGGSGLVYTDRRERDRRANCADIRDEIARIERRQSDRRAAVAERVLCGDAR